MGNQSKEKSRGGQLILHLVKLSSDVVKKKRLWRKKEKSATTWSKAVINKWV